MNNFSALAEKMNANCENKKYVGSKGGYHWSKWSESHLNSDRDLCRAYCFTYMGGKAGLCKSCDGILAAEFGHNFKREADRAECKGEIKKKLNEIARLLEQFD